MVDRDTGTFAADCPCFFKPHTASQCLSLVGPFVFTFRWYTSTSQNKSSEDGCSAYTRLWKWSQEGGFLFPRDIGSSFLIHPEAGCDAPLKVTSSNQIDRTRSLHSEYRIYRHRVYDIPRNASSKIPQDGFITKMEQTMKKLFSSICYISHDLIMSRIHKTMQVFSHLSNSLKAPIVIFLCKLQYIQGHLRTAHAVLVPDPLAALLVLDVLLFHLSYEPISIPASPLELLPGGAVNDGRSGGWHYRRLCHKPYLWQPITCNNPWWVLGSTAHQSQFINLS